MLKLACICFINCISTAFISYYWRYVIFLTFILHYDLLIPVLHVAVIKGEVVKRLPCVHPGRKGRHDGQNSSNHDSDTPKKFCYNVKVKKNFSVSIM